MSAIDKQTSAEVAHEAEDIRAGLAHTLDQLRDNLKPEHVVAEVVSNAKVGANTIADGLYALAKENPIPALLIGAGCAMVLGFGSQAGLRRKPMITVRQADPNALRTISPPSGAGMPPKVRSAGEWKPYRNLAAPVAMARSSIHTPLQTVQDTMSNPAGSFKRTAGDATSRLTGILHEQPLVLAALGVAIGAAIGAALPGTDVEDDWMGGTSATVKHAAQEAAKTEIDELKSVAGRTADNLKTSAADHGLSADNLSSFVNDAGEHAKTAIHEVATTTEATKSGG